MIIVLDSGPLGMISNRKSTGDPKACREWMYALLGRGHRFIIPEIADYEVRRELIRANKIIGIQHLDDLKDLIDFAPLTTASMLKAAEFWALARQGGRQTAHDKSIDVDVILAAQAWLLSLDDPETVIATTNIDHLNRFVRAELWQAINPDGLSA